MKYLTLIVLLVTGSLQAQIEKAIHLVTETGKIEGTLLYPETSKKIPLALIIAGSGPTDRNGNNPMMTNNSLKMLAEGLLTNNIASVRYDKRGIAKSKGAITNESDLRFEHLIDDVKSWIDFLKKDTRFSDLIIIGHSEGSTIGMIASQKDEVTKFISIAGPGTKASDKIKEQLGVQAPDMLKQALPIFEKLENGVTVENVPPSLLSLFRPNVQPYLISWFKYDPQIEIGKLNKPVLIIQGTTDLQVNLKDAENLLKGNTTAKKHIIEGMNHVLKSSEMDTAKNFQTYNNPDLPLKQELLSTISDFITK